MQVLMNVQPLSILVLRRSTPSLAVIVPEVPESVACPMGLAEIDLQTPPNCWLSEKISRFIVLRSYSRTPLGLLEILMRGLFYLRRWS